MDVLNEVIGGVIAARPPARDIDGDAMRVRKLPVPNMHAFHAQDDDANANRTCGTGRHDDRMTIPGNFRHASPEAMPVLVLAK